MLSDIEYISGFKKRLWTLINEQFGGAHTALARAAGIPPQTAQGWKDHDNIKPNLLHVARVAKICGVTVDWLLYGDGQTQTQADPDEYAYVPKAEPRVSAGSGILVEDEAFGELFAFRRDWLHMRGNIKDMILVEVVGESMKPTLESGDLVMVDRAARKKVVRNGSIYVVREEGDLSIKRVYLEGKNLLLWSDNPDKDLYPPRTLDARELNLLLGRAIWLCRDL